MTVGGHGRAGGGRPATICPNMSCCCFSAGEREQNDQTRALQLEEQISMHSSSDGDKQQSVSVLSALSSVGIARGSAHRTTTSNCNIEGNFVFGNDESRKQEMKVALEEVDKRVVQVQKEEDRVPARGFGAENEARKEICEKGSKK